MFSFTTLASAWGLLLPNVQVCPVVRSYTAAVTVPERSATYELAALPNGSERDAFDADRDGVALRLVVLGVGLTAAALDGGPDEAGVRAGCAAGAPADGPAQA
jgi:hypothetical protein